MELKNIFKEKLAGVHQSIGYVNPISDEYGIMQAIAAFEEILLNHSNWTLHVVGFGTKYREASTYIIDRNLEKKIFFYGPLTDKEIYDVFKRVDIIIVPSAYQNQEDKTEAICLLGSSVLIHQDHDLAKKIYDPGMMTFSDKDALLSNMKLAIGSIEQNNSSQNRNSRLIQLGS